MASAERIYVLKLIREVVAAWFPDADEMDLDCCSGQVLDRFQLERLTDCQWLAQLPDPALYEFDDEDDEDGLAK